MSSTVGAKRHVPELQSLRGIAALLVLFGHSTAVYNASDWLITIEKVLFNGHASVVFFFVLSGYVLFHMLSGRALTLREVAGYYTRRVFRIYPALWFASFVALIYVAVFRYNIQISGASDWFLDRFKSERFSFIGIAASFAGLLSFLLPQVWSIAVELFASVVIPGMVYVARKGRHAFYYALGAVLLVVSFTIGPKTPYSALTYLFSFWLGGALYTMPAAVRSAALKFLQPLQLVWLGGVVAVICSSRFWGFEDPAICLAEGLASALLILLVTDEAANFSVLRSKWMINLGDWSYSIYLLHFPLMCLLTVILERTFAAGMDNSAKSIILASLTTLVTVPISWLVYEFIERPGNNVGRGMAQIISGARNDGREASLKVTP